MYESKCTHECRKIPIKLNRWKNLFFIPNLLHGTVLSAELDIALHKVRIQRPITLQKPSNDANGTTGWRKIQKKGTGIAWCGPSWNGFIRQTYEKQKSSDEAEKEKNHPMKDISGDLPGYIYFASLALVSIWSSSSCLSLPGKLHILHNLNFIISHVTLMA